MTVVGVYIARSNFVLSSWQYQSLCNLRDTQFEFDLDEQLNWNRFVFSKLWSDRVEIDEEEEWGFE